jgi:hypothetical protein
VAHARWRTALLVVLVVGLVTVLVVQALASVPDGLRGVVDSARLQHDGDNVLQGRIDLVTAAPTRVRVELAADDHTVTVTEADEPADRHRIPLLQLRAETDYDVRVSVIDADGAELGAGSVGTFRTGALPDDLPPITVPVSEPERMTPGITLFNSIYRGPAVGDGDENEDLGYLQAVDATGQVVWYHRTAGRVQDATRLANGDVLYGIDEVAARRVTPTGRPLQEWRGTAPGVEPDEIGDGLRAGQVTHLPVHSLHHEIQELPDGTFLSLSRVAQEVVFDPPLCDGSEPGEPELVVGDAVVVFDPDTGEVLQELSVFDALDPLDDPHREQGDWCSAGYLDPQYAEGAHPRDWTHANSVVPIDDGRTWLVSMRHLDALVALRAVDEPGGPAGSVRWVLGVDSDDFEMVDDGRWFWHQHAPEPQADGSLVVYDNGNMRDDADEPYSRAVRYEVDVEAGTVEQVWEHRMTPDVYASFVGDADRLDGTVLITHGGQLSACGAPEATDDTGARIHTDVVEVDEATGDVVFQLVTEDDEDCEGWGAYRAERIPTIYPPAYEVEVTSSDG